MPKVTLCKPKYQDADRKLIAEIARGMSEQGKKSHEAKTYLGLSKSAWYARVKDPESFRLSDLRHIFDLCHTSDDMILMVFGRR